MPGIAGQQIAEPIEDAHSDDFSLSEGDGASTENLWVYLSYAGFLLDTCWVQSPAEAPPTIKVYVSKMSEVYPNDGSEVIVNYRYRKLYENSPQVDLTVEFRRRYRDESDQGILIDSWDHEDISHVDVTQQQYLYDLVLPDVDYSDLYLRFVFTTHVAS